jgi:aryl-alcohol dehydrogenase-like predicted oxidoreductase
MHYKLFGRSGLRVSELCLGTMTFGKAGPRGSKLAECAAMMHDFLAHGGNFIDTAPSYGNGNAEWIVGELISDRRDETVLATHLSVPDTFLNQRAKLIASVEGSLERLGTDRVDLLWVDASSPLASFDEVVGALEALVRGGKVLYTGVANAPGRVVAGANTLAALNGFASMVGLQTEYSVVARQAEREALPLAESLGMGIAPWGLLGNGFLTGKYARERLGELMSLDSLAAIDRVAQIARDLGRTPSQVALSWVRQQGASLVPIVGARTSSQLAEDLGCLDFTLAGPQLDWLGATPAFESEPRARASGCDRPRASA